MGQGLESTEIEVERPNQTVIIFALRPTQYAVLRCRDGKRLHVSSLVLAVFLPWRLSIDRIDSNICQH